MSDEQVWTLAKVQEWLREHGASGDTSLAIILASDIVYDYEQLRATLTAQLASLQADNEMLRNDNDAMSAQLRDMRQKGHWPVPDTSSGMIIADSVTREWNTPEEDEAWKNL